MRRHGSPDDGGGDWTPAFADEPEKRRIANLLLVTVLAHELGHHAAQQQRCDPGLATERELRADELSVPIVRELVRDPRLAPLHARMRAIADDLIAHVGVDVPAGELRAWVLTQEYLPDTPAKYASLHLARQRRILAEPPRDVAGACLAGWRTRLATRQIVAPPGTLKTMATWHDTIAIAVDPVGHVWAVDYLGDAHQRHQVRRLDDPSVPVRTVEFDGFIDGLIAFSDQRLALFDRMSATLLEGPTLAPRRVALDAPDAIAFDERGELVVSHRTNGVWTAGPIADPARWTLRDDTGDERWGDGSRAGAIGGPTSFAVRGDRLVFFDGPRAALRTLSPSGTTGTLAGFRRGQRDGAATEAELFDVPAIAIVGDGSIAFVDQPLRDTLAFRILR